MRGRRSPAPWTAVAPGPAEWRNSGDLVRSSQHLSSGPSPGHSPYRTGLASPVSTPGTGGVGSRSRCARNGVGEPAAPPLTGRTSCPVIRLRGHDLVSAPQAIRRDERVRTTRFGRTVARACEATGLDDLGDIPYREPARGPPGLAEPATPGSTSRGSRLPVTRSPACWPSGCDWSTTARPTRPSPTNASWRRSSSSASRARVRRISTRSWRKWSGSGRRGAGSWRCRRRRRSRRRTRPIPASRRCRR